MTTADELVIDVDKTLVDKLRRLHGVDLNKYVRELIERELRQHRRKTEVKDEEVART